MTSHAWSVVAVSGDPQRAQLLDALLADENDLGVIFVESTRGAYARIKELAPDLVIVFCEIDDVDACRLLSMLRIDAGLAGVLVVTCATEQNNRELESIASELLGHSPCLGHPAQMN